MEGQAGETLGHESHYRELPNVPLRACYRSDRATAKTLRVVFGEAPYESPLRKHQVRGETMSACATCGSWERHHDTSGNPYCIQCSRSTAPKVAICSPTTDHWVAGFGHDFARMMGATIRTRPEISLLHMMIPGSLIPKQREKLVEEVFAAAPETTHILWLDTDIRHPPFTLLQLLSREKRIVAANYVERRPPFKPVAFPDIEHANNRIFTQPGQQDVQEVQAIGFGCVLTALDVFRVVPKPWFCVGWVTETQEYVGEDVFFSQVARQHGEQIWVDHALSQHIAHVGTMEYTMANALQYHSPGGNGHSGPVPALERSLELVKP